MVKKSINHLLRTFGLLGISDRLHFAMQFVRMKRRNRVFTATHPGVDLPPSYLVYESYAMDFRNYWEDGRSTAQYVLRSLARHLELSGIVLLDWGCGPARVVRHIPGLLEGKGCRILGSDYNIETINWCQQHIPGITFYRNGSEPPLELTTSSVDALYGISVFTHLTPEQHLAWVDEIARILSPGGVAFLTTHGKAYRSNLLTKEKKEFDKGELIARGHAKIGHRTYTSFHPPEFMAKLFATGGLEILEHLEGGPGSAEFSQDVWIVRRPRS